MKKADQLVFVIDDDLLLFYYSLNETKFLLQVFFADDELHVELESREFTKWHISIFRPGCPELIADRVQSATVPQNVPQLRQKSLIPAKFWRAYLKKNNT